jgi:hypothetical protein
MLSKEYVLSKLNKEEDIGEQIREVPEMNDKLKALTKVVFKPKVKKYGKANLRLKGESSSSSNGERKKNLEKYNFG